MLYDLLKKRLAFFDSSISLFKKKIQGLPYGILKAGQFRKKDGAYYQYFCREGKTDSTGRYLKKNEIGYARKLAQKEYYEKAMMIKPMKWFCRLGGKQKYSDKDVRKMKAAAERNAADRNPYSWNMEFRPYADGSGYEARFSKCGICALMKELGLYEQVPVMCHLDYAMSEASGVTDFVRKYTLASGGPYCDCGYKKKRG